MFREKVSWTGYKYAPESFLFFLNGKNLYLTDVERFTVMPNSVIDKHTKDRLIQVIRQRRKNQRRKVTFGFWEEGYKEKQKDRRFFYTRQLEAYDDDFSDKLRIYKEWKHYLEERDGIVSTHEVTSGKIIPGQKSKTKTMKTQDKADLTAPLKIYYK